MMLAVYVLALGAGTFALRLAGPALRAKVRISERAEKLMAIAVAVLFAALVATSALIEGHSFAGIARPAGVLVGGVLAWRKAPFVVVVIAAAGVAALLRLAGVP
jgi:branched-subunit amino acid transport protein